MSSFDLPSIANQVIDRCASTNDLATEFGRANFPEGTWVSARIQSRGKGRHGNHWISEEGNLFLSMLVRVEEIVLWTWMPILAALGVIQVLRKNLPKYPVRIKWPNDLWLGKKKLGGILCEASGKKFIVIGLGLNVGSPPKKLASSAVSLFEAGISLDLLRENIILEWQSRLKQIRMISKEEFIKKTQDEFWKESILSVGAAVQWISPEGREVGQVQGLGPSGELRVVLKNGKIRSLYDEVIGVREFSLEGEDSREVDRFLS